MGNTEKEMKPWVGTYSTCCLARYSATTQNNFHTWTLHGYIQNFPDWIDKKI